MARDHAKVKSRWLARERLRIASGAVPVDRDTDWDGLKRSHDARLQAAGASPKTTIAYNQAWKHFENWPLRPSSPSDLTVADLQSFMAHLRNYRSKKTNGPLSKHSIAALARHVRALLNYGRKVVHCIRLDAEAVGEGLKVGRLPKLVPESYNTAQLKAILKAARDHDAHHPKSQVFPLVVFLMVVGCRLGEAESLRWSPPSNRASPESWVDFTGKRIVIFGRKTQADRSVPLGVRPYLAKMLKRLREAVDVDKEPYVFGGSLPLAVADRRRNQGAGAKPGRSLKSAIDAVKQSVEFHWSPHSLRSNLATYLANSRLGANLYTLAGELGHDYAILVKHYAGHLTLNHAQSKAKTVEALLGIVHDVMGREGD